MTSQLIPNFAQTFRVGVNTDTTSIKLTAIDLFFKYKPDAFNNRSGLERPGITLYLTTTSMEVPSITEEMYNNIARCEWEQIVTSSDASMPTNFQFQAPIAVENDKLYAFIVSFDGNEIFYPWTAKVGNWLVGTDNTYTGPTNSFIGSYFEYVSQPTSKPTLKKVASPVSDDYHGDWRKLNDTFCKFKAYAARYWINGVPIVNAKGTLDPTIIIHSTNLFQSSSADGTLDYGFPSPNMEHVSFDLANSSVLNFIGAQRVYQNTVFYPGGYANNSSYITVSTDGSDVITANSQYPNGTAFSWEDIYSTYAGVKTITLFDTSFRNVRVVRNIVNNSVLQVTEPVTFTNNITKFMITPVATVDSVDTSSPRGKTQEFLTLKDSTANSTVRFVNNCVEAITITNGGTGYDNSDIFYLTGYEDISGKVIGGYKASANIRTNGSGVIQSIYLSNLGCGFVNASNFKVTMANSINIGNTVSNTSAGTGAAFTYTVGATLCTELTDNVFKNCTIVNLDINDAHSSFEIFTPTGTSYSVKLKVQYYLVNDNTTFDGFAYYVYPGMQVFDNFQLMKRNRLIADQIPIFMSYSNEFVTLYSNGAVNDQVNALAISSNNVVISINTTSNNDWSIVTVDTGPTMQFGKYIINNDYTNEHTNHGNCWAKHIATRTNFQRLSEDIRIFLDAYKPSETDIQVYARIQNSGDPIPFDDEDWTRLTLVNGLGMVSSMADENDYVELTYAFQPYPNTDVTLVGTVSTTNNSPTISGSGTAFDTALAAHDMVRIYDSLFPANNFIVATVNNVVSATSLNIDQPILSTINPALVQSGMKIDRLDFPHQAYNNITNDNVVRYYNTSMTKIDGYDILQIKVCLLSSRLSHYPRIHDIRAVGVSA